MPRFRRRDLRCRRGQDDGAEGWLVGCHREDGAMCFTERGVDFFTFDFSLALFPVIGRMDGWMALNGKLPLLGHHPHP